MRCLVTGGAGFIGSWLCRELSRRGARLSVLDDLSTGRLENLAPLAADPDLRMIRGDVRDEACVRNAARGCTQIYHLAAAVGVRAIARDPAGSLARNVIGGECVARVAASLGAQLLFTSSSEVYGSGAFGFSEQAPLALGPTSDPRWSYGCGKACTEFTIQGLRLSAGLRAVVVRLFNTVGPGQLGRHGMVLPTFARQALAGEAITIARDGRQRRSFAHVREVVAILADLMDAPRAEGGTFNVGGLEEVSILELAQRVRARAGSSSVLVHLQAEELYGRPIGDLPRRVPDLRRLRELIGRLPGIPLDAIIDEVIAHMRARGEQREEYAG